MRGAATRPAILASLAIVAMLSSAGCMVYPTVNTYYTNPVIRRVAYDSKTIVLDTDLGSFIADRNEAMFSHVPVIPAQNKWYYSVHALSPAPRSMLKGSTENADILIPLTPAGIPDAFYYLDTSTVDSRVVGYTAGLPRGTAQIIRFPADPRKTSICRLCSHPYEEGRRLGDPYGGICYLFYDSRHPDGFELLFLPAEFQKVRKTEMGIWAPGVDLSGVN